MMKTTSEAAIRVIISSNYSRIDFLILSLSSVLFVPFSLSVRNMSTLSRSIVPFIRTSRLAVRQQKGINPVQQVFGRDLNGARGLATAFQRTKPHVNIGVKSALVLLYNNADRNRNHWPC